MIYNFEHLDLKYIRIFSDIHLDFDYSNLKSKNISFDILWKPPKMNIDKKTILILAGDLWHSHKIFNFLGKSWLKEVSKQFGLVLVVLGNHDFWNGTIEEEYDFFHKQKHLQEINNLILLQNSIVELKNVTFIGNTLWTDFGRNNKVFQLAEDFMKDYKYIKIGNESQKLTPNYILNEHLSCLEFLKKNRFKKESQKEKKLWVITHHAPSISKYLKENNLSNINDKDLIAYLYYNNLDYLIKDSDIDCWVHGHIHRNEFYKLANTKIISNPKGYRNENEDFKPYLTFDINGNKINFD